jgi:hypothetical protein
MLIWNVRIIMSRRLVNTASNFGSEDWVEQEAATISSSEMSVNFN